MKVPLTWLAEYVPLSLAPDDLAHRLTMAGAEVEAIEQTGAAWDGVRVGRVQTLAPHPNADKLRLATVDYGGDAPATVVCGAPNITEGQKIAFAVEGTELTDPSTGKRSKLKKAKIRGVESRGMVCSERELGLSDEHTGILVLPDDAAVGTPLAEVLGDTVYDISVTPNRADLLSILGIAREVAALTGGAVREPVRAYPAAGPDAAQRVDVTIEAPDLCPRYVATVITGVTVGPSPDWVQDRLRAAGMRPINNVVDVTNYVMLEMGQPLHAFDLDTVAGPQIIVRRARDGERIRLIDDTEHTLHAENLVIADADRATAIAGVMGGGDLEVSAGTVNVLLESATFIGPNVRRTAAQVKQRTEASARFEKGLHPELAKAASERATQLLVELTGGVADAGAVDAYPAPVDPVRVVVPAGRLSQVLGVEFPPDTVRELLTALGFGARWIPPDRYAVDVPYWRGDIRFPEDVAEEVARIKGYDALPSTPLRGTQPEPERHPLQELSRAVQDGLAAVGMAEVINYAAVSVEAIERVQPVGTTADQPPLPLLNPMSSERDVMRTTLRPGVLSSYATNWRQARGPLGLFEVGRVFHPRPDDLPVERTFATALYGGQIPASFLGDGARAVDFYDAKAVAEALAADLGVTFRYAPADDPALSPGHAAALSLDDRAVGVLGLVRPEVLARFDIADVVFLIEFDLDALVERLPEVRAFAAPSRFPAVLEDLAIVVDASTPAAAVEAILLRNRLVEAVTLFDVYEGDPVPAGKRSLAYAVTYRSPEKTLTDKDVQKARQGLVQQLERELGASLRE